MTNTYLLPEDRLANGLCILSIVKSPRIWELITRHGKQRWQPKNYFETLENEIAAALDILVENDELVENDLPW